MRTTINIDDELLAKATKLAGPMDRTAMVNGTLTNPTIASCNASKGAINQLTRVMARSFADQGVRVNAVAPGAIATELARNAVPTSEEANARIMSRTPMKRLGEPGEIADVVASCSPMRPATSPDGGRMTLKYTVPV